MTEVNVDAPPRGSLPEPVREVLDEFREGFGVDVSLWLREQGEPAVALYPEAGDPYPEPVGPPSAFTKIKPREGPELELEIRGGGADAEAVLGVLKPTLEKIFDFGHEIRFFTYELSERYEEINLLYSISETL